jgi:rhodanese-related sulfurtransferase
MHKGLLIGCLLMAVWGVAAWGTPIVTVDEPDYDFGEIGQGYMVKHTFILRNTGDETLDIVRVRTTCGCSTAALPTNQLAPGDSVPLEVLVLVDYGSTKHVTIMLHTNAPGANGVPNDDRLDVDLSLTIRGRITPFKQAYEKAPYELADELLYLIDVRDAADYASNHLMGAIHVPAQEITNHMARLPKSALIIVYDVAGEAADGVVQTLADAGYYSAYYLQGGLSGWVRSYGNRYLVHADPLPPTDSHATSGSSGRPWNLYQLNSDYYVLIDLRTTDAYASGHLAGAMNIQSSDLPQWFERFPKESRIILYDDDQTTSLAAYRSLADAGYTRVSVLLGGLNEWIFQYGLLYILAESE